MIEPSLLKEKNKEWFLRLIAPLGTLLSRLHVHPNTLTCIGLIFSFVAGVIYSQGVFFWAGLVVLAAGTCDVLDGQMARETGMDSKFGAFWDSNSDRFGELFIFLGLAWHFSITSDGDSREFSSPLAVLMVMLALSGSLMVSYTRARAEGLGIECKVGWMQRPERMVLLILASLFSPFAGTGDFLMLLAVVIIAVMSHMTAIQRILYVKKRLRSEGNASKK